jgi:prepilin-type N-terminal cleavage/methylation domain-containing protein
MKTIEVHKGFTLIEILITLAILVAVLSLAFPVTLSTVNSNRIENVAKDLASLIYSHQQSAYSSKNNKSYGVYFETNLYVLFAGDSYASAENLEQKELSNGVTISSININGGGNQILFPKGEFKPQNYGYINITNNYVTYRIDVNQEGLISSSRL